MRSFSPHLCRAHRVSVVTLRSSVGIPRSSAVTKSSSSMRVMSCYVSGSERQRFGSGKIKNSVEFCCVNQRVDEFFETFLRCSEELVEKKEKKNYLFKVPIWYFPIHKGPNRDFRMKSTAIKGWLKKKKNCQIKIKISFISVQHLKLYLICAYNKCKFIKISLYPSIAVVPN